MTHRVLIVEDEAIPALELRMRLEKWGFDVVDVVVAGADAISTTRRLEPDLVIMDVILADDVRGTEAARVIQAELGTPILFLTALDVDEQVSPDGPAPRLVLTKPYDPDLLAEALSRLLR